MFAIRREMLCCHQRSLDCRHVICNGLVFAHGSTVDRRPQRMEPRAVGRSRAARPLADRFTCTDSMLAWKPAAATPLKRSCAASVLRSIIR
jgi:hypothetical protein